MSWEDYINKGLINKSYKGHNYTNILTDAAIIGHDGTVWATTGGIAVKPEEVKKLREFFKQSDNNTLSIIVGGKKYQVIHYEAGKFVYLAAIGGGATIAPTTKAFIIGIYNRDKKYRYDGKELPQCVGMCNTVVEELANNLKGCGY